MAMKNTNNLSELYKGLIGVKSWLSRGFVLILALFTLAVGQMWGVSICKTGTTYIYLDRTNMTSWTTSGNTYLVWRYDNSAYRAQTSNIANTKLALWYGSTGWDNITHIGYMYGDWGASGSATWSDITEWATDYTNSYNGSFGFNNGNYSVVSATGSSKNWTLSPTYMGTTASSMNKTITVKAKVSTDGGSSYSEATSPGTLSASSNEFTAYNSCSNATSLSSGTITCGYTATTTLTAPSTDPTGYTFVGWYNSSGTQQTTSKTLTIYPTADATYYAYYNAKQTTITLNGNSGTGGSASVTGTYGLVLPSFTKHTREGYKLDGYYTDASTGTKIINADGTLVTNVSGYTDSSNKWARDNTTGITLYAHWLKTTVTGTISPNPATANTTTLFTFNATISNWVSGQRFIIINPAGGFLYGPVNITNDNIEWTSGALSYDTGSQTFRLRVCSASSTDPIIDDYIINLTVSAATFSVTVGTSPAGYGTVSPTSISASPDSWSSNITATPNAGYQFVNWTSSGGGISINGATANPTQIKATSTGGTLTANFSAATYRVTLDNQSATTAGTEDVDATYNTTTLTTINKPTKTNYTFGGYYTATDGGGTQIIDANGNWLASKTGFTDSSNKSIITENKTLYAKWTETTYAVTVAVDDAAHAAGNIDCSAAGWTPGKSGTAQIGNVTNVTITVPAGASGYTYTGGHWTLTGGVTLVSGASTDPSITVKATAAGSATFTYAEDLSTSWYIAGATGTNYPFTGWGTSGIRMYKKAGYSNVEKYYCNVVVNRVASGNEYEFQTYNSANATYYGYNNKDITKANNSTTVYSGNPDNMRFKPYLTGTYEFEVDNTGANPVLTVHWPVINQLRVSSASPSDGTNTGNFDLTDQGSNNWSVTRTLNANTTYTFKMVFDGEWYGKNSTNLTRASSTATGLSASGANMTVKTDVAGEYTFTFNSSSKNLSITYPTAYTVTYGAGTSYTSMGSVSTEPSITSGDYVLAGTSITFTATPNLGYKFIGWYSDEACTNSLSTDNPYTVSVNAEKTVYAKFDYRDLYIHADWIGDWGTAQMTQSEENRAVYTYELDPLNAKTTPDGEPPIYNGGWHFQFVNTTVDPNNNRAYTYEGVQTPTGSGIISDDQIHKTADGNPTIQFYLTQKSKITITLTLQSTDDATKPTVNIAADPYYTITTAKGGSGATGITIIPASVEARSGANSAEITATIDPGYTFVNWTAGGTITINSENNTTTTIKATGAGTLTANATANSYTVHFNGNGDTGGSMDDMPARTYGAAFDLEANGFTKTGYEFAGWATTVDGAVTYANGANVSNLTTENNGTAQLYAKWSPVAYTVTLDGDEEHNKTAGTYALTGGTATFDAALPSFTGTLPTAADGYAFMGFYSEQNGNGVQIIDANGAWIATAAGYTSGGNWVHEGNTTLYAYYKKAEITAITLNAGAFEPVTEGEGWVIANPTIEPTPAPTTIICWEMLYDNDNPVPAGHEAIDDHDGSHPNRVKFSIAGLAAGSYKIRATLHTGDGACGTGTTLSVEEASFTIASDFIVTVQYKCGDVTIQSSTTSPGKPLVGTEITAPDIIGYTFSKWKAGDGVTIDGADASGEKTTATINYTANYNGTLTAIYTKKNVIYFYNTLGWSDVYVYFYNSEKYWDNTYGTGAKKDQAFDGSSKPYWEEEHGKMTQIEGTNIWYFDYTEAGYTTRLNVAFTKDNKHNTTWFWQTEVVRRGDHKSALPMFVPLTNKSYTKNECDYYNEGYWMNYPENTGYTLRIYPAWNADKSSGASKEYFFPYSADLKMPLKLDVEFNYTGKAWFMIYRNDDHFLGKDYSMTQADHVTDLSSGSNDKIELNTSAAGVYTFTLSFHDNNGDGTYKYYIDVDYPVGVGDYRILYNDRDTWSQGAAHTASWWHESNIIRKNSGSEEKIDTVSLFVSYGYTPSAKFQKVTSINSSTGVVTWGDVSSGTVALSGITEKGVYNFIVSQPAGGESISLTKTEPYTGNFYIRTDNAGTTKWDNYRSSDHRMTYTEFSMSDANTTGEKYSHYYASWCERSTNIKFVVANDYSSCITDTLEQDVNDPYKNTTAGGYLKSDGADAPINDRYSANVRFMYNETTNKISRAYVGSATNAERKFLILEGNEILKGEDDEEITDWDSKHALILVDKQNWIYEHVLKIKPGTRFKLYSNYAQQTVDPDSAQYFRGAYESGAWAEDDSKSVILIGGSGGYQMARVIYDFKTNRLMTAWIPSGADVSGDMQINADVLVEREHQEPAQYITFADSDSKLSGVKTVYGAMKFNRWILNNRQNSSDDDPNHGKTAEQIATHHAPLPVGQQKSIYERSLYFISFPFDVNASDIFGFGHYWDEWYLEYYDGETRAKNGYWKDSPPNWKYVMPSMLNDFVLKANEGYILGLDLDYMQADNFDFWSNGISTVELFFPSTVSAGTLQQTNCTIPALSAIEGDPYRCTINRGTPEGDRRVKDSYWRCLGVPSFNIYNTSLYDGDGNAITWQPDGDALPFIYAWNKADNTLTAQSTSTFTFLPMHAYLVQNGGEIRWTNVSAKSSIVARRANEQPQKEYNWDLTLVCDSQLIDRTYIRMSNLEQVTDSFDFGQDLNKEFNSNRSDIYTYIGYEKVAANSMPIQTEQTTIVAVGVNVEKAGDYTFAMPEGTYGVGVTLIDTETGVRTHLGLMDYTVTLAKGDYTNRFILEISPVSNTPTDIELINGENGDASLNGVRKVLIDNKLFLIKGDKVYDATGRCIN